MEIASLISPSVLQAFISSAVICLGASIGSFLNVVIYRVPLGISVNHPKRSFCPICKNQLRIWQNIPILSWLFLRGKCAHCGSSIPVRYLIVEMVTAGLFFSVHQCFSLPSSLFLAALVSLFIVVTWIDAEHLIIPTRLTWAGSIIGIVACFFSPELSSLAGFTEVWSKALIASLSGWATGFFGLWLVVELGKKAFGKKQLRFDQEVEWCLREPEGDDQPLLFIIDREEIPWWDLFFRKSDRLILEASTLQVDGREESPGNIIIHGTGIELSDGRFIEIEKLNSLSGKTREVLIPREAMGMGDIHLLGMIGAFFGVPAVFFSLIAASFTALFTALVGKIGLGKPLPFGPFLAFGAVVWMFGGWKLWKWYVDFLGFNY